MANLQLTVSDEVALALQTLIQSLQAGTISQPLVAPKPVVAPKAAPKPAATKEAFIAFLLQELPTHGFSEALCEVITQRLLIVSNTSIDYRNWSHLFGEVRDSQKKRRAMLLVSAAWRSVFGCGDPIMPLATGKSTAAYRLSPVVRLLLSLGRQA